jgi:hypothetical protein
MRGLRDDTEAAADAHKDLQKAQDALYGTKDPAARARAQAEAANAQSAFSTAQGELKGLDPKVDAERGRSSSTRSAKSRRPTVAWRPRRRRCL